MKKFIILTLLSFVFVGANAQKKKRKDYLLTLTTNKGVTHMILYDETPLHKANFIKLVKSKFYDSLTFHRVMENFMIQGGDPESKKAKPGARLGSGGSTMEKIPFEYNADLIHKKGALAMASNGNAEKQSSGCQFYIVHGRKFSDDELTKTEKNNNVNYTNKQRADYMAVGGAAFLDNRYTVFGTIIDNFSLVDEIAAVSKDEANRPNEDIRMKITARKYRKKRITRKFGYVFK